MMLGKKESNIGDTVKLLGEEYKVGDKVEIAFKNRTSRGDDDFIDNNWIGYIVGTSPANDYNPYHKSDKEMLILTSIDPRTTESHPTFPWHHHYKDFYLDTIVGVYKQVSEKDVPKIGVGTIIFT